MPLPDAIIFGSLLGVEKALRYSYDHPTMPLRIWLNRNLWRLLWFFLLAFAFHGALPSNLKHYIRPALWCKRSNLPAPDAYIGITPVGPGSWAALSVVVDVLCETGILHCDGEPGSLYIAEANLTGILLAMSRSIRHKPVVGYGPSEKRNKVSFHRKLRRKVNDLLQAEPEATIFPADNEVGNIRRWRKAPRGWYAETCQLLPELMRK